jgi:CoA:oxalate CoA-transferase
LLAENPRLVCASITGYGQRGPWSHRRSFAPVVQAEAGITRSQGDARGGEYRNDPHSHGDVYTAKETVAAILAALYRRERTGRGQLVEVSMAETMLYVNEHAHLGLWDRTTPEGEVLSFRPADYPILRTADGALVQVSGHPAERGTFELYAAAIGRPELADDPRFRDTASRLRHLVALVAEVAVWAAAQPDAEAAIDGLAEHGLAAGRLRDVAELADTQWARERHSVVAVDDRVGGTIRLPNSPWVFSDSDASVRGVSRYRGEDNRRVLRERLGLTDAEVDRLEADGVLVARIPPTSTT